MKYQPFRDLPSGQYEAFKADIEAHGVRIPIVVDEHGEVLDGHQRRRAAAELGINCPLVVAAGLSEDEKQALALALNAFRRQLSGVERSQAIANLKQLGWSSRRIADMVGVGQATVLRSGEPDDSPERSSGSDAFGDAGLESLILDGIGFVTGRYNGQLDDAFTTHKLANLHGGANALLTKAENIRRSTGNTKGQCVAAAVVEVVNQGSSKAKKLPSWWKTDT